MIFQILSNVQTESLRWRSLYEIPLLVRTPVYKPMYLVNTVGINIRTFLTFVGITSCDPLTNLFITVPVLFLAILSDKLLWLYIGCM